MSEQAKRYRAFISYSQRDKAYARRLHRALESYRLPSGIEVDGVDAKSRKLGRLFRDDDEMGAETDLGAALQGAIADAENLIVVCSPNSAKSHWVNEEIIHFKRTGRADRIFAVIVGGDPTPAPDRKEHECFPPALQFELGPDGVLTDQPTEPLGLDLRRESFSRLIVRLAAGLVRTPFDALWNRERRRSRARTTAISFSATAVLLVIGVAATQFLWRPELDRYLHYTRFAHSAVELNAVRPGTTFQDCDPHARPEPCPVMVVVPEGSVTIGAEPTQGAESTMGETIGALRLQQVTMPRFAVSRYEITWANWRTCVAARRCPDIHISPGPLVTMGETVPPQFLEGLEGNDRPLIDVTWREANEYVRWLADVTGEDYRLLTEQEWEYAARGVTSAHVAPTRFYWGDDDPAWCDTVSEHGAAHLPFECFPVDPNDRRIHGVREGTSTWPVGSFRANPFGLYDMIGNVAEWTDSCPDVVGGTRSGSIARSSECDADIADRVVRGFEYSGGRASIDASRRTFFVGFRVARTL